MSVSRNPNGSWSARWWEGGRKRQATFRTKRDAQEAERLGRDRERGRKHGLPFERGPITYDELCELYLSQHQVKDRSLETLRERLARSRRTFGNVAVR